MNANVPYHIEFGRIMDADLVICERREALFQQWERLSLLKVRHLVGHQQPQLACAATTDVRAPDSHSGMQRKSWIRSLQSAVIVQQ